MRKGGAGAHAAQQKKARLTAQREAKRKELEARLNEWFLKFDTDKSGDLNRHELKQLLVHAHPDAPEPSEQMLDMLIERATAVESGSLKLRGDKDGTVSWLKLGPCIQKYDAFVRQQAIIEDYFSKHDTNQNSSFDEAELLEVSIAPPVRQSSSPLFLPAQPHPASPHLVQVLKDFVLKKFDGLEVQVDEDDVGYIFEQCDMDNSGSISRDELLPALAAWKEISTDRVKEVRHTMIEEEFAKKPPPRSLAEKSEREATKRKLIKQSTKGHLNVSYGKGGELKVGSSSSLSPSAAPATPAAPDLARAPSKGTPVGSIPEGGGNGAAPRAQGGTPRSGGSEAKSSTCVLL